MPVEKLFELPAGAAPHGGTSPDIIYGTGADRLKVAWLRSYNVQDGTEAGLLAVIRPAERFAELYALGAFRGHADRVRFTVPRIGGGFVVAAEDDGCKGRKANDPCDAMTTLFLPHRGKLERVAEITTERFKYLPANEKGAVGILEAHGQATLQFTATGVGLTEVVEIHDNKGRTVRRAERERTLTLEGDGLVASDTPLWDKVVSP
jgi:hypothetical protein